MALSAVFFVFSQVLLIQGIYSQSIRVIGPSYAPYGSAPLEILSADYGYAGNVYTPCAAASDAYAAPYEIVGGDYGYAVNTPGAPGPIVADNYAVNIYGSAPLEVASITPVAAYPAALKNPYGFVPASGGSFLINSFSPISPSGLRVLSENAIEGNVLVSGDLPFLSAIALDGILPTAGAGGINYGCGGAVGIISENAAYGNYFRR